MYGPNIDISWNQIVNHWQTSCVEDVITFYADPNCRCGGTAASRAQIHDNMIDGGWPRPGAPPNTYAGSGTNVDLYGDGYGAFADFHNNQYVALCNTGAAVSAGQSSYVYNNRVVCSGRLPDDSDWYRCRRTATAWTVTTVARHGCGRRRRAPGLGRHQVHQQRGRFPASNGTIRLVVRTTRTATR